MSIAEEAVPGIAEVESGGRNRGAGRGRETWLLLALILLGFGLRVLRLEFQPLWWDEGYSVWFATHPLGQLVALTAQDIHPPLYYALLHGWTSLLGTGPVALRLLSVFAGVLLIPAVYRAARCMFSSRAALLAALLAAINPLAIFYSQEIRMYGLVALLSTGVLLAAWRVLAPPRAGLERRAGPARVLLPYVLLMTAALYTQYYAVFLPIGLTLFAIWRWWRNRRMPPAPAHAASDLSGTNVTLPDPGPDRSGVSAAKSPSGVKQPQQQASAGHSAPLTPQQQDRRLHGTGGVIASGSAHSAGGREASREAISTPRVSTQTPAEASSPWKATSLDTARPRDRYPTLACWFAAQAIVALLYLPWAIYAGPKLVPYVSQKVIQDADRPLGLAVYFGRHLSAYLAGHLEGPLAPFWPAALLLLIPLALGLVWILFPRDADAHRAQSRPAGDSTLNPQPPAIGDQPSAIRHQPPAISHQPSAIIMLLLVLASALLLGWLVGLRYPFFPERGERLLLLALPAILLLAAAALDALFCRARILGYATFGLIAAVSVAGLSAFYVTPRYAENDYRPLLARIVEQGLPGDTLFAVYPWQAGYWRAYGDPNAAVDVLAPGAAWGAPVIGALETALEHGRVWFPAHLSLGGMLEERIEDYLGTRAVAFLNEWHGPNTRLSAWAVAPPASPVVIEPTRFSLPGGDAGALELSAAGAQSNPVPAANAVLPLSLTWRAGSAPPVLDVSVRLTDDLGQIWAQHDYEPVGGMQPTGDEEPPCDVCADKSSLRGQGAQPWQAQDRLGLLIPAGTPPGRYHVEVVLLPKGEARPLSVIDSAGRLLGASARLFDITVSPADRPVGPEHLPISSRRPVDMEGGLRLLGYSMDNAAATPGDERKINLFWQTESRPTGEYTAFVQLLDRWGQVAAGWEAPPGAGYPTQAWEPGALIRTQASIRVPADLPDGSYRLIGGLFRTADKTRLRTTRGDDAFDLGRLGVRGRSHDMNPPAPARTSDAKFDNLARLVGYDLAPPADGVSPGDALPLTLYWQALGASPQPFTVFVQLLDGSGAILGSGDGEPAGGRYPTTGWLAGEYLTDPHAVIVRPDAPASAYRLSVGLYNPATGERLKTGDGADHLLLDVPVLVR
jgi:Dolichyl-phosphate-mannose-protein mannosyltransferase